MKRCPDCLCIVDSNEEQRKHVNYTYHTLEGNMEHTQYDVWYDVWPIRCYEDGLTQTKPLKKYGLNE